MKKTAVPLFALVSALAALASLAFANNVVAIVRWWRAFLEAGGDTSLVGAHAPGFLPWLDWSAVDYSAVTTLIPALGLLCMARALWRMLRGKRMRAGDFPFFRGSDQLNVALGLFGTLWGIIVIGYFKLDAVTMADLMQCLHTALFSTLTAVVWVFLVDRPLVRPYFTRLLERSGLAETDDGDLAAAVDRLVVRLVIVILHTHCSLQEVRAHVDSEERVPCLQRKLHRGQEQIHARGLVMQMLRYVACGLHVRKRQRAPRENAC